MPTSKNKSIIERPILFSTPMVQAIMEGRKTVTRRIIKESFNGCLTGGGPHPCPNDPIVMTPGDEYESPDVDEIMVVDYPEVRAIFHCSTLDSEAKCRQGKAGDILWVRETWSPKGWMNDKTLYAYKAEGNIPPRIRYGDEWEQCWKPSIFMPKEACRLKLKVVSITVEALHDITEEDAIREGIKPVESFDSGAGISPRQMYMNYLPFGYMEVTPLASFESLWRLINGDESWESNPWVWRIEFEKL